MFAVNESTQHKTSNVALYRCHIKLVQSSNDNRLCLYDLTHTWTIYVSKEASSQLLVNNNNNNNNIITFFIRTYRSRLR